LIDSCNLFFSIIVTGGIMQRMYVFLFALLIVGLIAWAAAAEDFTYQTVLDEPGIDNATLARLIADGQIMIVRENPNGRLKNITSGILINRPLQTVYDTVADYGNYTKFMPSTDECEVVADNGNVKDVRYKINFKFLIFKFSAVYTLRTYFSKAPNEITWKLLSSEKNKIKQSVGSWRLIPVNGGKQTAAFYSLYSDISNVVPGLSSFINREPSMEVAINASTCLLVLKAVKHRSENPAWEQPK